MEFFWSELLSWINSLQLFIHVFTIQCVSKVAQKLFLLTGVFKKNHLTRLVFRRNLYLCMSTSIKLKISNQVQHQEDRQRSGEYLSGMAWLNPQPVKTTGWCDMSILFLFLSFGVLKILFFTIIHLYSTVAWYFVQSIVSTQNYKVSIVLGVKRHHVYQIFWVFCAKNLLYMPVNDRE